ncbi:MAG: hypothetical protein IPH37_16850 [Burkholderiales bacterium]|nr:hypothetical protein [Burkholderiales bacterium]
MAQAQVKTAQASIWPSAKQPMAQARVDLARTRALPRRSMASSSSAIERSQTVASSLQAPGVCDCQNLQDMQVDAAIDGSDVGRLKAGQKPKALRWMPSQPDNFEGEVRQVERRKTWPMW